MAWNVKRFYRGIVVGHFSAIMPSSESSVSSIVVVPDSSDPRPTYEDPVSESETSPTPSSVIRDEDYYWRDGNCVIRVQDRLFKVRQATDSYFLAEKLWSISRSINIYLNGTLISFELFLRCLNPNHQMTKIKIQPDKEWTVNRMIVLSFVKIRLRISRHCVGLYMLGTVIQAPMTPSITNSRFLSQTYRNQREGEIGHRATIAGYCYLEQIRAR